jgi:hypothetical protein
MVEIDCSSGLLLEASFCSLRTCVGERREKTTASGSRVLGRSDERAGSDDGDVRELHVEGFEVITESLSGLD